MFPPDDADAVAQRPPTPAAGVPGWFDEGDPVVGRWPTLVRGWFLNMLVAELKTLLAFVEMVPVKGNDGQVLEAVQRIAGATGPRWNRSAPGVYDWRCPAGTFEVLARFTGGGGRGGPGTTTAISLGGGGGGCIAAVVPTAPGTDYTITIFADGTVSGFGLVARAGKEPTTTPGVGGAAEGGPDGALRFYGGGGGYGNITGGTAFSGGGGSCAFYGQPAQLNTGGLDASHSVPGLDGTTGVGGSGGPNGPGGAGGPALAELHW